MIKAVKIRVFPTKEQEDLNVAGMMKNKHLADKTAEQKFYEFTRQMK